MGRVGPRAAGGRGAEKRKKHRGGSETQVTCGLQKLVVVDPGLDLLVPDERGHLSSYRGAVRSSMAQVTLSWVVSMDAHMKGTLGCKCHRTSEATVVCV